MKTWSQMVAYHASRRPESEFIADPDERVSYAEMNECMARRAAWLASHGASPGDRVSVLGRNSVALVEILLACQHLGAVVVTLNSRLSPVELGYMLDHSESRLLVADAACETLASAAAEAAGTHIPVVRYGRTDDLGLFAPMPEGPTLDLCRLMYTSGTTNRPKGVMVTNNNVHVKSVALAREFGLTYFERGLVVGPMYHVGTLDITVTNATYVGGAVELHHRFDPRLTLDALRSRRIDHVWLSPTMMRAVLAIAEEENIVCLGKPRLIVGGGERSSVELIERIARVFPDTWYTDAYGLTETTINTLMPAAHAFSRAGSVGLPIAEAEVVIIDEAGDPCPRGVRGQIAIGGEKVSPGYWRNDAATAESRRGSLFLTGDVGYFDADGFLYIVGRLKDMILSGGENIAAAEVEDALVRHPEVREAAVVARPDARWGEVPVAFVVIEAESAVDAAQLEAHCQTLLSRIKRPKEYRFVEELPRTSIGKVHKSRLVELLGAVAAPVGG